MQEGSCCPQPGHSRSCQPCLELGGGSWQKAAKPPSWLGNHSSINTSWQTDTWKRVTRAHLSLDVNTSAINCCTLNETLHHQAVVETKCFVLEQPVMQRQSCVATEAAGTELRHHLVLTEDKGSCHGKACTQNNQRLSLEVGLKTLNCFFKIMSSLKIYLLFSSPHYLVVHQHQEW